MPRRFASRCILGLGPFACYSRLTVLTTVRRSHDLNAFQFAYHHHYGENGIPRSTTTIRVSILTLVQMSLRVFLECMGSECTRCQQSFGTPDALEKHLLSSRAHNICHSCTLDFPLPINLLHHYLFTLPHNYCQRCDAHYASPAEKARHLEATHNQCLMCGLVSTMSTMTYG